ncbi:hypothetical protein AC380_01090 [Salmonella enterica]|nr:hypothetical protein [Salmonella enterica]EAM8720250.1 hypothetical protein [Salmonella enterica]EAP0889200.1 hypothetical protein [Salmonella enterica]ECF6985138.1 hypothetical protein [Salmonella enterica subsp. enterica]MKD18166.1 hypothetical protein [Salmonella enterica]
MGNLRHETWHRRPFSCADANVLLLLNLPPNQALNHKAEFTITLAYDKKTPKPHQHKKPL